MATVWRCPPESEATGSRTDGMRADELVQKRPGPHLHGHLVEAPGVLLAAEIDVRHDIEVLAERKVLEDGGDAEVEGGGGVAHRDLPAQEAYRAGARLMDARENLDERRFAGPVVAHEGNDLARMDVELDVGQGRDCAEILG